MSITKNKLFKVVKSDTERVVANWVWERVEQGSTVLDALKELIKHGFRSGIVPGLTVHVDIIRFYDDNADEIWEVLGDLAQEAGYSSVIGFLAEQTDVDGVWTERHFKNDLAWLAFKEIARRLYNRLISKRTGTGKDKQ